MKQAYSAMIFAMNKHKDQVRKYTGEPYSAHLAEVAGIAASVATNLRLDVMISVAWLHDCIEDQGVGGNELFKMFGYAVANAVCLLSDMEEGNRAERKRAARVRLSSAPDWVQTIKVADLISNTSSIVKHDARFAPVYLEEKQLLLEVLTLADKRLIHIANEQLKAGMSAIANHRVNT